MIEKNENKLVYTVADLQNILPLGKNSLYKLIQRNDFPKIRCGRKILIPIESFTKWLLENAVN